MKIRLTICIKIVLNVICLIVVVMLLRKIIKIQIKSSQRKYILIWSDSRSVPFRHMGVGPDNFTLSKCQYQNCIITANKKLLGDYKLFNVIAFRVQDLMFYKNNNRLPKRRSPLQKYVFVSMESSHKYPLCSNSFEGYFNWTWTYKLDSEVRLGFIVIKDSKGTVIGPKADMKWLELDTMERVSQKTKDQLNSKTRAAVWFPSDCRTNSQRENFVLFLQDYLLQYHLDIDIYGKCGHLNCLRDTKKECNKLIESDYYFYLSFEDGFSEDYVTEELLIPLQNNAIPIVYGGANYTRFLPNGSYLNANELGIYALGDKMLELINDPEQYAEYFRWKNHYSYHKTTDSAETNEYCQMCTILNNGNLQETSVYNDFRKWWNPPSIICS